MLSFEILHHLYILGFKEKNILKKSLSLNDKILYHELVDFTWHTYFSVSKSSSHMLTEASVWISASGLRWEEWVGRQRVSTWNNNTGLSDKEPTDGTDSRLWIKLWLDQKCLQRFRVRCFSEETNSLCLISQLLKHSLIS